MNEQQLPLDLGPLSPGAGRVEQSYANALGGHRQLLEPADAGLAGLALALARAADQADAKGDVRGLALVAKELREVSTRLRLDPTARGGAGDPITELLADLGRAEQRQVGDPR